MEHIHVYICMTLYHIDNVLYRMIYMIFMHTIAYRYIFCTLYIKYIIHIFIYMCVCVQYLQNLGIIHRFT